MGVIWNSEVFQDEAVCTEKRPLSTFSSLQSEGSGLQEGGHPVELSTPADVTSEEFKRILHGGSAIYIILQIYSPANLIKLFTSLAPNYVQPAIRGPSINRPSSLNRVEPPNVTFPFRTGRRTR